MPSYWLCGSEVLFSTLSCQLLCEMNMEANGGKWRRGWTWRKSEVSLGGYITEKEGQLAAVNRR